MTPTGGEQATVTLAGSSLSLATAASTNGRRIPIEASSRERTVP